MNRRDFLKTAALMAVGAAAAPTLACDVTCSHPEEKDRMPQIQTVLGPVKPEDLGLTLIHEHLLVDFPDETHPVREDHPTPRDYDADEVVEVMRPYLVQLREAGGKTLVECTPKHLGRDAKVFQRLAEASGVQVIAATGFYYEGYVPRYALEASVESMAKHLVREAQEGMDGTGIRPGLIKIATDADQGTDRPLSRYEEKMTRAAAQAHLQTGLPIACHTGQASVALQQLKTLAAEGVGASAFVWVHADAFIWYPDSKEDIGPRREAAERGAWIELDSLCGDPAMQDRQIAAVRDLLAAGLEQRILLSQDAGWYTVGQPRGGTPRPYHKLLTEFAPALERAGLSSDCVKRLLTDNPRQALTPVVRKL